MRMPLHVGARGSLARPLARRMGASHAAAKLSYGKRRKRKSKARMFALEERGRMCCIRVAAGPLARYTYASAARVLRRRRDAEENAPAAIYAIHAAHGEWRKRKSNNDKEEMFASLEEEEGVCVAAVLQLRHGGGIIGMARCAPCVLLLLILLLPSFMYTLAAHWRLYIVRLWQHPTTTTLTTTSTNIC